MARAELIPVRPVPVNGRRAGASFELAASARAPVALKLYRPGDPLLIARFTMSDRDTAGRLEARGADGVALLSGLAEAGESQGDCQARLTLDDESGQRLVHLPPGALSLHMVSEEGEEALEVESPELLIFPPAGDLSFAPRGLPAELLRDIADAAASFTPAAVAWKAFVDKVFEGNPPLYDRENGGRCYYTDVGNPAHWDTLTFHIARYNAARTNPKSRLNCYDAAAYLQVLLKPTYPTRYCYMNKFGYLRKTDLIGWGQCNNPFTGPLVVPEASSGRSCFGNHAFCAPSYQGTEYIADACAGPHYDDTPTSYVAAAVDTQTPAQERCTRGNVANISYYRGVVNVQNLVRLGAEMIHFMVDLPQKPFAENRARFMRAISYRGADELAEPAPRHVPDPSRHPALAEWRLTHEDLVVGYPETSRQWRFARREDELVLTCWVSDGAAMAHERFLLLGSTHQSGEAIFGPGPEGLGDVSARSLTETPVLIWAQGNIAFQLQTTDPAFDVTALALDLAGAADEGAELADPPEIDLKASPSRVRVGEIFSILVEASEGTKIDFALSADLATFEGGSENELTFLARAPGSLQIAVAAADTRTLLSRQRTESVTIVD
ncbi:MAG TPA: hypothetical protein VFW19_17675 [Allosphingosinicella sp.]|nr:hypothetical protein [Allosphingosinicella sp.]